MSPKLRNVVLILSIIGLLNACSAKKEANKSIYLNPGFGRIIFKEPNRVPNVFKEKLFGQISSIFTESDSPVPLSLSNSDASRRYVDLMPGSYKIKVECDPVKNYSGKQVNWLASKNIVINAGQITTLGCESYSVDDIRKTRVVELKTSYR